jgi:hypothetical protein
MRLAGHVISTGEKSNAHRILLGKYIGSKLLGRLKLKYNPIETLVYASSCDIYILK